MERDWEVSLFGSVYRGLDRGVVYRTLGSVRVEDVTYSFVRKLEETETDRRCIRSDTALPPVFILDDAYVLRPVTP